VERVRLRDGTEVAVRPVTPEDREAIRASFQRMGPDSRYKRFLSPVAELSESQLDYLTDIDHHDHEALVAISDGIGLGVARYVRLEHDGRRAEVAVAVIDDWQGRGLGSALLERLSRRAREDGIEIFTAAVLADNRAVVELLTRLGSTKTSVAGSGQLDLEIELEGDTLSELMQHAASGALQFAERIRTWRPGRGAP
jgi:GNAT superfamily N-acetyltransferase